MTLEGGSPGTKLQEKFQKQSVAGVGGGISYLDLLPSHGLQLTFLPQGEFILDHFGPGGDGELEVVPILHNL